MSRTRTLPSLLTLALIALACAPTLRAQQAEPKPSPQSNQSPTSQQDEQEPVKIFTEEVRLPIFVTDEQGRFDPTLEMEDVLVREDDVPQEVRSLRHLPASVLLLLDTSGQMNPAMKLSTTRALALALVSHLKPNDEVSVVQFGPAPEVLQNWTRDLQAASEVIKTRLGSSRRSHLSEALVAAAASLKERPAGGRHLVIITDGVEAPGAKTSYEEAVRRLNAAQATVHIISYTALGRALIAKANAPVTFGVGGQRRKTAADVAREADPTIPAIGHPSAMGVTVDTDMAMRRRRDEYVAATKASEQKLAALAQQTGGRLWLLEQGGEIAKQGYDVAREIGAQYVVTYKPRRALASAPAGEYRRVEIVLRRPGLNVRSRPGYIAK